MKKSRIFAVLAAMALGLAVFGCKAETLDTTAAETPDTTAPADVTELAAAAKDSSVVLTWKDATDNDVFGYLVSWKAESQVRWLPLKKTALLPQKDSRAA